ncbi:Fur family transcriptional regulator [Alicyclobacillus dauci]|uniref:Fur family transcriptional regulator n=1 Tax=Alicyclobacillus dauci TaxID=1475485 RepID=UPI002DD42D06|nr:transcriptional repressor [Alicyclobacillus dauci]
MSRKVNWTTQRRVIYDLVRESTDHPTANDIMERLRQSGHHFAYGTVYNSLRYLVEMALIRELKLGNAISRYDARIEDHLHVICDVCGKVAEAAIELPADWLESVSKTTHFH